MNKKMNEFWNYAALHGLILKMKQVIEFIPSNIELDAATKAVISLLPAHTFNAAGIFLKP